MSASPCRDQVESGAPRPRASRMGRRRATVLVGVHLLIAAHVGHWLTTGRTVTPLEPSEAMEFAKRSVVNAGLVFFALTTVSTLVLGRFFCGWACHVVALQDLCRALLLRVGIRPRPLRSRALALVPLVIFAYMFLWPVAVRAWSGDSLAPRGTELTTGDFWRTFPPWWGALATFAVCGFAAVYFLGAKGFCTYGCPYGALFGAVDRLAPGRIRVTDACEGCGHCTATCSSNVAVAREVREYGMVVDPGCMKCLDCVSVCPTNALYFGFGRPALGAKPRVSPGRKPARAWSTGEEMALAATFALAFFCLRGLYGVVPLLLAVGAAGILAAVLVVAWRAARPARHLALRFAGLELRRDGRLLPAGRAWLGGAALGSLLLADSVVVQVEGARAAARFEPLQAAYRDYYTPRRRPLDAAQEADARAVLAHASRAVAWSLLPDARRENELAWASLLLGDDAAFVAHIERAIAHGRRPAIEHFDLGNHLRLHGDVEGAAEHYAAGLAIEPDLDADYYGMLADVLTQLGRGSEAREVLDRAAAPRR